MELSIKQQKVKALEKLKAITMQHYVAETENEIILSDDLMKLFKCERLVPKPKAKKLFKILSYPPHVYQAKIKDLDIMIHMINGTMLIVPE